MVYVEEDKEVIYPHEPFHSSDEELNPNYHEIE